MYELTNSAINGQGDGLFLSAEKQLQGSEFWFDFFFFFLQIFKMLCTKWQPFCSGFELNIAILFPGAKYQEEACSAHIEALKRCCEKFWERSGVCAGVPIDKTKASSSTKSTWHPQYILNSRKDYEDHSTLYLFLTHWPLGDVAEIP